MLPEAQADAQTLELPRSGGGVAGVFPIRADEQPAQDVKDVMAASAHPLLMPDPRPDLPHLSDTAIPDQPSPLERRQELVRTGQRNGTHYALAEVPFQRRRGLEIRMWLQPSSPGQCPRSLKVVGTPRHAQRLEVSARPPLSACTSFPRAVPCS